MQQIQIDLNIFIQEEIFNIRLNENSLSIAGFDYENNIDFVNPSNYSNKVTCEIFLEKHKQKNVFKIGLCGDAENVLKIKSIRV